MALTATEPKPFFRDLGGPEKLEEPPEVVTTPSDPWPRPYYLEGGLRRVYPYHYTYNTHCKERWRGKTILEIFADEFRDRPLDYYKNAIEKGHIVLNGKPMSSTEHMVKNGDMISHTLHRHEPPVAGDKIGIVHEDNDMIVINKPAGIPVHPTGRYQYNTVTEVMRAERGHEFNPSPANRLDRLTSGIMFIGKHRKAADTLAVKIRDHGVRKEYVARVVGNFPDGEVVCEQPILQISPKLGLNRIRANGKEARTVFRKMAYYPPPPPTSEDSDAGDGDEEEEEEQCYDGMPWRRKEGYSIVRCLPLTGRTHQLRVHLQFLGHPIENDPIYCNQRVFGHTLGRGDAGADNDEDVMTRLARMGKSEVADAVAYHSEVVRRYTRARAEKMTGDICAVCNTPLYSDPGLHELGIYLHARRYACIEGGWSYETALPDWALPPAGEEGPRELTAESDVLADEFRKLDVDDCTALTSHPLAAADG